MIPRSSRVFLGVIFLAALLVAVLGLFRPARLAEIFAWVELPPLHARFVGSLYLFGTVFTFASLFTRSAVAVRWAVAMIVIFTGTLLVISLVNLGSFDLGRLPERIWFASYIVYPIFGLWLLRRSSARGPAPEGSLPALVRTFFLIQGVLVTGLAVALLVLPGSVANAWPWPVSRLLAQLYAGPLLAIGIGSLLHTRARDWMELRAVAAGMFVFTVAALTASFIHRELFSSSELADWIWFIALGVAAVMLLAITAKAWPPRRPAPKVSS